MTNPQLAGWLIRIVRNECKNSERALNRYRIELAAEKASVAEDDRQARESAWDMGQRWNTGSKIPLMEKSVQKAENELRWAEALYEFTLNRVIGNDYNFCPNTGIRIEKPPNS